MRKEFNILTGEVTEHEDSEIILPQDNRTYAEKRQAEYPPIGDQLDALFHAGVFPTEMASQIQAIKNKYPKG